MKTPPDGAADPNEKLLAVVAAAAVTADPNEKLLAVVAAAAVTAAPNVKGEAAAEGAAVPPAAAPPKVKGDAAAVSLGGSVLPKANTPDEPVEEPNEFVLGVPKEGAGAPNGEGAAAAAAGGLFPPKAKDGFGGSDDLPKVNVGCEEAVVAGG